MNENKTIISIKATFKYRRNANERIDVIKENALELSGETQLRHIEGFYDTVESIFKEYINFHKPTTDCGITYMIELDVLKMYDNGENHYDRWEAYETNQDGEGLFFEPDTKYTDGARTMYITKNVRKDLASYVI